MVQIIRKAELPSALELGGRVSEAAALAHSIKLREPRPAGFPLLFTGDWELIEPAVAFLHEHGVQRAHSAQTVRTYAEILFDWFETLEQNDIAWDRADASDLVAYRNRMLSEPSAHTQQAYRVSTINHRVRGVLRFYNWAVAMGWLRESPLADRPIKMGRAKPPRWPQNRGCAEDRSIFVLRQFEPLPRPLTGSQACELLAVLPAPYDLMARWQLYTGLRLGELLELSEQCVAARSLKATWHHTIEITRKGGKPGYVIAPVSLIDETQAYLQLYRQAWARRAARAGRGTHHRQLLFLNPRGVAPSRSAYQRAISTAGQKSGFKATTHLLRATFACMLLARLEQLATDGATINPLMVVKVLMGHEHIDTTDRYLRAIAVDPGTLKAVLDTLLSE